MARNTAESYGNESISQLKGEDRVRKRPAVIFGSDGLEGCEHAVFEILSNSIDEARAGNGSIITLTRYLDKSIECEDFGRGCPVDWNPAEKKYNWELVFCELYAGGKYRNNEGGDYEYSLGLNGLGTCATQYSSEYMDVTVRRDGKKYTLHFEKGRIKGKLERGAGGPQKDRHGHPLEAGPRGVHGHRHPARLLHGDAEAPGRRERGRHLPPAQRDSRRASLTPRTSSMRTASSTTCPR